MHLHVVLQVSFSPCGLGGLAARLMMPTYRHSALWHLGSAGFDNRGQLHTAGHPILAPDQFRNDEVGHVASLPLMKRFRTIRSSAGTGTLFTSGRQPRAAHSLNELSLLLQNCLEPAELNELSTVSLGSYYNAPVRNKRAGSNLSVAARANKPKQTH